MAQSPKFISLLNIYFKSHILHCSPRAPDSKSVHSASPSSSSLFPVLSCHMSQPALWKYLNLCAEVLTTIPKKINLWFKCDYILASNINLSFVSLFDKICHEIRPKSIHYEKLDCMCFRAGNIEIVVIGGVFGTHVQLNTPHDKEKVLILTNGKQTHYYNVTN